MLFSEIQGWHYFISWDNPFPPDSSTMLKALAKLGKVTKLHTKTTVALSPKAKTHFTQVRDAIRDNLHQRKGNALYVNLRSGKGFQISANTGLVWTHAP